MCFIRWLGGNEWSKRMKNRPFWYFHFCPQHYQQPPVSSAYFRNLDPVMCLKCWLDGWSKLLLRNTTSHNYWTCFQSPLSIDFEWYFYFEWLKTTFWVTSMKWHFKFKPFKVFKPLKPFKKCNLSNNEEENYQFSVRKIRIFHSSAC